MPTPNYSAMSPSPSNAGIVQRFNSDERVVPSSVRKDGSVRKEIKIRPGYTPSEDVMRYKIRQRRELDSQKLAPVTPTPTPTFTPTPTPRSTPVAKTSVREKVPDAWDDEDYVSKTPSRPPQKTIPTKPVASINELTQEISQLKVKDEEKKRAEVGKQHENEEKQKQKEEKKEQQTQEPPPKPTKADLEKRARALHKKLRQAESLRDKQKAGEKLLVEQETKVKAIPDIERDIQDVESKISALNI